MSMIQLKKSDSDYAYLEQEVEDEHLMLKESKKFKINQLSEFKEVYISPLCNGILTS